MTLSQVVRREWLYDLALLVGTRLALIAIGVVALAVLPMGPRHLDLMPHLPALDMWAQWDAQHYVNIAVRGYDPPTAPESNIAFFPLYPLLIRIVFVAVGRVDTQTGAFVGLVISNVALFVALLYLSALVARDFSLSLARRDRPVRPRLSDDAVPLVGLRRGRVPGRGRRVALPRARRRVGPQRCRRPLAALTRPFGVLLIIPIAVELYRQRARPRSWLALIGPPLGLALFIGYLWWLFGDPLAYFHAGTTWGRGLHPPWDVLLGYIHGPLQGFDWTYSWLDLISMIAMVAILIVGIRLVPASYSSYSAAGLLFRDVDRRRVVLRLAPCPGALPADHRAGGLGWRYRAFNWAWLAFSIMIAVVFMLREAVGYWVT